MKKLIIPFLALMLFVASCGGPNLAEKVIGTWKIDMNSIKADGMTGDIKSSPQYKAMEAALSPARLDFKSDGTVSALNMGTMPPGKWMMSGHEIKSAEKDNDKTKLFLSDDNSKIHMTITQEDGKKMEFDWVKA